jgi:uncharacterized protein (TIGR00106 family)
VLKIKEEIIMVIMEISIVPLGTKSTSVSAYVAKALKVLDRQKEITYELHPMGTVMQAASLQPLLEAAAQMHEAVLSDEIRRVVTTIKIDHRKDKNITMQGKIKSVENKMDVRSKKKE